MDRGETSGLQASETLILSPPAELADEMKVMVDDAKLGSSGKTAER